RVKGQRYRCQQIAALRYASHHALARRGTCEIVTGYGLTRDGCWFPHSWLWDGSRVVETNAEPLLYFGVVLTPPEASAFVLANLTCDRPGGAGGGASLAIPALSAVAGELRRLPG